MAWNLNSYKSELKTQIEVSPHISFEIVSSSSFLSFTPRDWQVEGFNAWGLANQRASVTASTGTGKTKLAMMVIEQNFYSTFLIVVPTVVLQKQWKEEIENLFPTITIGLVGGLVGGDKNDYSQQITIAVINSIREETIIKDVLIMDETHRYASEQNIKFLQNGTFTKVLALTATMKRQDGNDKLITKRFPIVYNISQKDSIERGYLSKYIVVNKSVYLTESEQEDYDEHERNKNDAMENFKNYNDMMDTLQRGPWNSLKKQAMKANRGYNGRKKVLNNSINKIKECVNLIKAHPDSKIIVFNELKKVADKIYKILSQEGLSVGLYHSGLNHKKKSEMIEKYINDDYKIMVTVKALDEGLDVKTCDIGIVVSGNSTTRQSIQRVGRILRTAEGKDYAKLYQLYVPNTQDTEWLKSRLKGFKGAEEIIYT